MNRGRHRKKTDFYNISSLPAEIKQKMIKYQVVWGNKPDLEVFEKNPRAGVCSGGFPWNTTEEGFVYWDRILGKMKDRMDKEKMKRQKLKILPI